jgi:hypothetical protein
LRCCLRSMCYTPAPTACQPDQLRDARSSAQFGIT